MLMVVMVVEVMASDGGDGMGVDGVVLCFEGVAVYFVCASV